MSHFKAFYNDWLDYTGMLNGTGKDYIVNLDPNFFYNLKFDSESLKQYRIDAALRCIETLGGNPALCFSGGIDSQCMLQAFTEANLKFDTIILVFNDGLNKQDSDHAKLYCEKNNIKYKELPFDIITFLTRDNYSVSEKYHSISPHFNTHYKMAELLKDMGYTGVCCGGLAPQKQNGYYGKNFDTVPFHFLKIQQELGINFQGSFLSFYPELAWVIALQCEEYDDVPFDISSTKFRKWEVEEKMNAIRYVQKIKSYQRAGFDVIPQSQKYTGFELVKKYFENLTGDGWTFERRFRYPIARAFAKDANVYKFCLTAEQQTAIDSVYLNNIGSSDFATPWI